MKVQNLIKMLERCPRNMDVKIAYDSFVCIYPVEEKNSFIIRKEGDSHGVYLCAMGSESTAYHMAEEGGESIPLKQAAGG